MKAKVLGIIPARYASTRLPSKLLIPLQGKTLLQRTFENAKKVQILDEIMIATDDQRIFDHVLAFGGHPIMTSVDCPTGTDRLAEALQKNPSWLTAEAIVNIQGDQPFVHASAIQSAVDLLLTDPQAQMSTLATPILSLEEAMKSSIVKCVMDLKQNALYFSRALIPSNIHHNYRSCVPYYHHIGVYVYRPAFILQYQQLSKTPLELEEKLEQLRVLEHGFRIKVALTDKSVMSVDTPEDLKLAEQWICKQSTFS